jgi:hypothetical protein
MKSFSTSVATVLLSLGAAGFFFEENMWQLELASTAAARRVGTRRFMGNSDSLELSGYDRE